MRRPFLRRADSGDCHSNSDFLCVSKAGNAGADRVGFRRCICADARAFARLHPAGTKGLSPCVGLRRLHIGACSAGCSGAFRLYSVPLREHGRPDWRIIPTLFALTQRSRDILETFNIRLNAQATPVEWLTALVSWGTGLVARSSVTFAAKAGQSVFALVIAYYLLCERRQIGRHLLLMLPVSWREAFLSACLGCKNALMSYLSGVLKTSLFVFVATLTGLFLLGINDALLLSVFMGILEVFPYIGPILASVPILLTALGQGFGQAVLALIVVIAVQQIEGNFVTPYFTASSTSIKPLSALIGVFVLGSLMGLWGVVLAIPLIVTVRSVLWSIRSAVMR